MFWRSSEFFIWLFFFKVLFVVVIGEDVILEESI